MAAARRWVIVAVAVLSAAALAFLWLSEIPLGISGEWTWQRIPFDPGGGELLLALAEMAIVGAVLLLIFWGGLQRIAICSRRELTAWLAGLTAAGFVWLSAAQSVPPSPWDSGKIPFVVYYPGISGYFHKARYEIDETSRFLKDYEALMSEGDVLHVGTHPPGLFLLYRGLWRLMDASPSLCELAEATMPESVQESFTTIEANLRTRGRSFSSVDKATIWMAAAITQLACAATVLPLFVLTRLAAPRDAAWRAVVFWPLLPALTIFLPKSDVLFTFPAASLLACWLLAVRKQSVVLGALSGAIGWGCLLLSLAFLPIGLMAVLCSLAAVQVSAAGEGGDTAVPSPWCISRPRCLSGLTWQALLRPVIGGLAAFVALTVGLAVLADVNLGRVWLLNYQNHAGFYAQFERTWWKWLLVNPVELAFACGLPVAVLAVVSVWRSVAGGKGLALRWQSLSVVVVWGLLWLSGKNSGEAARLWIPLLPVLVWQLAVGFECSPTSTEREISTSSEPAISLRNPTDRNWLILLVLQMAVCSLTALRVTGFHFNAGPPLL